jgi:ribosome-binding factor A
VSNRTVRVNELIQRELSDILHRRYQADTVALTITEVRVAPDLRDARLFVSIIGTDEVVQERLRWLRKNLHDLRMQLGERIVLKHMPRFTVSIDKSTNRGNRILQVLDEIGIPTEPENPQAEQSPKSDEKKS